MARKEGPERGHFLKIGFQDWFQTEEAREILRDAHKLGLPSTHMAHKEPNKMSGIIFPFQDGDSRYKKIFFEPTWFRICAKASAAHFNYGLIWLANE